MTSGSKSMKVQLARMAAGMVVGAVMAGLFMTLVGPRLDLADPGTALAVVAGLSYGLMGLGVALGVAAPKAGARFLNVEDEEEIVEQRRSLAPSAIACMLIGLFLLLLAVGPTFVASAARPWLALGAGGALAALVLITLATRGRSDELTRQISVEASAMTLHIALVVLAGWAAMVQLGYGGWMSPLTLVAGLALLELAAIFAISARKGLMRPR
jgi:cytochrome bd-type quinol oxidase subunit 2